MLISDFMKTESVLKYLKWCYEYPVSLRGKEKNFDIGLGRDFLGSELKVQCKKETEG